MIRRCQGERSADETCIRAADYHAQLNWTEGTLLLCGECVTRERDAGDLEAVHSIRQSCPTDCELGSGRRS